MAASEENVRRKTTPAPPPFGPKTKGPRPLSAPPSALLKEVAQTNTSEDSSNQIVGMLRMISDFERIGSVTWTSVDTIKTKHDIVG